MDLVALATKYGTDKLQHGYIPFYEKHLPKEPKRILEIGVKEGASIRMWADYFPGTQIHALDLFEEIKMPEDLIYNENVQLHKGNQCDWRLLEELRKFNFDVIIDDGSHNSRDQLITFFGLFNGKHYFVEDLHCCNEEFYSQGLPELFRIDNVLADMWNFNKDIGFEGITIAFNESKQDEGNIVCIQSTK